MNFTDIMSRMDSMSASFEVNFKRFLAEARLAFPAMRGVLEGAERRLDGNKEQVQAEFKEDVGEISSDDALLCSAGNSRLLRGFVLPEDTPAENRARTLDWLKLLSVNASVPTPDDVLKMLPAIGASGLQNLDLDSMSLQEILQSKEGINLTKQIGQTMGMDIDMDSPEVKQAMNMMEQMLF